MRIAFVASEMTPLAKTGGLGDVAAGLTRFLADRGEDVRVFLPFYRRIQEMGLDVHGVDFLRDVPVRLAGRTIHFSVFTARLPESGQWIYLVHYPPFFDRPEIYDGEGDEHLRFTLLSRAALECCQRMGWSPQVVHCNDWHTALVPLLLRTLYRWDRLFSDTRTVLTIHNLGYQGSFPGEVLSQIGLDAHAGLLHQEDLRRGQVSFLKTGVLYADLLSTVSRTYALEIQTPDPGWGLHELLRQRWDHLVGIVNGVDYREWDPARDDLIPHSYGPDDLAGKLRNKQELLERLGLTYEPAVPTLGVVSRLTEQKGLDLLFEPLPRLLATRPLRFVVLGTGEARYERFFDRLQRYFPGQVCFYRGYSEELAHLIEAGADIFLMPSRYEPCGLNQMYSLRYGTVPVVRRTGGLADTVKMYDPATGGGTGFVFDHFTPAGLRWALELALEVYEDREAWRRLMLEGMAENFSWEIQGQRYLEVYERLIAGW